MHVLWLYAGTSLPKPPGGVTLTGYVSQLQRGSILDTKEGDMI